MGCVWKNDRMSGIYASWHLSLFYYKNVSLWGRKDGPVSTCLATIKSWVWRAHRKGAGHVGHTWKLSAGEVGTGDTWGWPANQARPWVSTRPMRHLVSKNKEIKQRDVVWALLRPLENKNLLLFSRRVRMQLLPSVQAYVMKMSPGSLAGRMSGKSRI